MYISFNRAKFDPQTIYLLYNFLAHIFFDDAFENNEYGEPVVNSFVKQLLEVVDVAAG